MTRAHNEKEPPAHPLVDLDSVSRVYRQGRVEVRALTDVTLQIWPQEFVAVMGPSGSGKSTLMNLIGCLDRPTCGRYLLDGENVASLGDSRLCAIRNRKIGFVFQSFNLLPRMNAMKNVNLPLVYSRGPLRPRDACRRSLEMVGLGHRLRHTPSEMSGGEQQRVAIARALVNDPPIIFADEPTGNLDTRTSQEIISILQRLNDAGKTIVMVTHEQEIAHSAKRVLRFRDGRLESDEQVSERTMHDWAGSQAGGGA
ncbi:MAG: ABC transporter ATP-binding protein [Armatimonadetes bacterium]|nr:ABC transporter ATP-binding protein [Armatimonadota bacterium]